MSAALGERAYLPTDTLLEAKQYVPTTYQTVVIITTNIRLSYYYSFFLINDDFAVIALCMMILFELFMVVRGFVTSIAVNSQFKTLE